MKGELIVDVPKFHSMPLMNINSDWMSNTSSTLCSMLSYACPLIHILGCNYIERILYFGE